MGKTDNLRRPGRGRLESASEKIKWLIGIDEVGRGPLAGPVGVALCAIPFDRSIAHSYKRFLDAHKKEMKLAGLEYVAGKDSKKIKSVVREEWFRFFSGASVDSSSIRFLYASKSAKEIDGKGISVCIRSSIEKLLAGVRGKLDVTESECLVLLDGSLRASATYANQMTIVKGDEKELVISFASIFAKVTRDAHMKKLSKKSEYSAYGFGIHKGYGTAGHRRAIAAQGLSDQHRKTYCGKSLGKAI